MVDADTVARLRVVIGRLARELNATATGEGLTPTQASVLGLVSGRGPLGMAELAGLEGLNPTMLSRVVGRLDELGLVRRLPDPADARAVRADATPEGREVHERIRAQRTRVVSQCLDRLPEESARTLLQALPALELLVDELRSTKAVPDQPGSRRG